MSNLIKKVVTGVSTLALSASMLITPFAATSVHAAMAGEVYKSTDGTVWFITSSMTKRPFTSWGAFQSYGFLSQSQIKEADASVTALSTGDMIAPQDGRIFCATATKGTDVSGECSLITGGMKAAFTSSAVFSGQGYSFARAFYGDSSFLTKTSNVDNASAQHRPGTLINNNGTIQLVVTGGLWGTPSMDVFNSWGWNIADVVPANSADVLLSQTGVIAARTAGQLSPSATTSNPTDPEANCDDLDGSAGSISVDDLSDYSGEEVGEGEEEVPVLAFEVEADNDSDVAITSIKVEFNENGAGSEDFDDYASEVQVWHGSDMIGSADVEDFDEDDTTDGTWTKTISLDCAAVGADETEDFTISVSANNVIDTNDQGEAWLVDILNVRFEDADGVTTTEDVAADVADKTFTFESFASATDIELNVSLTDGEDGDAVNDARVIDIDDTDDTDDAEILAFSLENEGTSDITLNDIPVVITTTGEGDEAVLLSGASLWYDGEQVSSDTVPTGGAVVFEDIDMDIEAGETLDFIVAVDIQDTDGVADNGDTVQATVTVAGIDAEDEEGDDLEAGDLTGSAVGDAHGVFEAGIMVELVSTDATITNSDTAAIPDRGNFTLVFDVTAFDSDVYIDGTAIADEAGGATYQDIRVDGGVGTGVIDSPADDAANTTFKVEEGTTERFTVTIDAAGTDAFASAALESILYALTPIDGDVVYNFNMDEFETNDVFLEAN